MPPVVEARSLNYWTTREVPEEVFLNKGNLSWSSLGGKTELRTRET